MILEHNIWEENNENCEFSMAKIIYNYYAQKSVNI
jgi:hypothetical protein